MVPVYAGAPDVVHQWAPGVPSRSRGAAGKQGKVAATLPHGGGHGSGSGVIDAAAFNGDAASLAAHLRALDADDAAYSAELRFKERGITNPRLRARFAKHGPNLHAGVCAVCDRVLRQANADPTGARSTSGARPPGAVDVVEPTLMKCEPVAKDWRRGAEAEERASAAKASAIHELIWEQRRAKS